VEYPLPPSSPSNNQSQQQPAGYPTVGELAASARRRALDSMTGNTFAQMLLNFDNLVEAEYLETLMLSDRPPTKELVDAARTDELQAKALMVIQKFRTTGSATEMQLCLLWLDGKGWGGMTLAQLAN
jgi:hypothetical protein